MHSLGLVYSHREVTEALLMAALHGNVFEFAYSLRGVWLIISPFTSIGEEDCIHEHTFSWLGFWLQLFSCLCTILGVDSYSEEDFAIIFTSIVKVKSSTKAEGMENEQVEIDTDTLVTILSEYAYRRHQMGSTSAGLSGTLTRTLEVYLYIFVSTDFSYCIFFFPEMLFHLNGLNLLLWPADHMLRLLVWLIRSETRKLWLQSQCHGKCLNSAKLFERFRKSVQRMTCCVF